MEDLLQMYKAQIEALQLELQKKELRLQKAEKLIHEMYNDLKTWKHHNLSKEQIENVYNTTIKVMNPAC